VGDLLDTIDDDFLLYDCFEEVIGDTAIGEYTSDSGLALRI